MVNPNVIYRVTGRYMDGQKIIGYHLVGEDGSQAQESRERVIWLIGKGIISNMRIQVGTDGEVILRGKGINLNNLPVYDPNKDKYRNTESSQQVANSSVSVRKSNVANVSPMGQYTITHRIMLKNKCLGYQLIDHSGTITRKKRDDVIRLAVQKLISNAVAQRYTRTGSDKPELILRGVDCELGKLPILVVGENGKIVDPTKNKDNFTVRSAYMKHSGIVHDTMNNTRIPFKAGDFIICEANGEIVIKDRLSVEKDYKKDTESAQAFCDDYLEVASNCYIELFGSKPIQLTQAMIKSWVILKPRVA